jgi:hypothetical protein
MKLKFSIFALALFFTFQFCSFSQIPKDSLQNKEIIPDSITFTKYHKIKIPVGTDFWICFMKNYTEDNPKQPPSELFLELFLTSEEDTRVTIEVAGINYRTQVFVKAKTVQNVRIPSMAEVKSNQTIEKLAVHIVSEKPIFVYGLNRRFQTTDTFLSFPVEVLGTEYRVMCYTVSMELVPIFAVVATEDGTEVTITPTYETAGSNPPNIPFTIKLNKGEVYQVFAKFRPEPKCDLTGTYIKANKKIAVFAGHQCAYVPPQIIACNHLVEQIPPIPSWGKHFYVGMLKSRRRYSLRVLANEPTTRVFFDGKLVKTLNGGEFLDSILSKPVQVTANKPILVAQFSHGFRDGDSIGDPMMLLISPTQQFLKSYRFATPVNGQWRHWINVVIPTIAIKSLRLDGFPVDSSLFTQMGISRYSIGYIQVPFGTHSISADLPFGMYSYGFGYGSDSFDAYGTMAGQSFIDYEPAKDTLPPTADGKPSTDGYNLFVRDDREDDTGLRGISIIENVGFDVKIPKIEEGTPQILIKANPIDPNLSSRLKFIASDAAMNVSEWTLCYTFDAARGKSYYELQTGLDKECKINPGYQFGIYGLVSLAFNSPSFSSTGNLKSYGKYQNSSGLAGFFGLSFTKFFTENLGLTARLTLENFMGEIEAPDTISSRIRLDDGTLATFTEGRKISLLGSFLGLSILGEFHLPYRFFIHGGLEFDLTLSRAVEFSRYIISPPNYTYSNNQKTLVEPNINTIESLSTLRSNLNFGFGYQYFFHPRFAISGVLEYKYPLSSLITDGDWYYHRLSLIFGIRYRF